MKSPFQMKVASSVFVIALLIFLGISWLSYDNTGKLVAAAGARAHTHEVIGQIHELLTRMVDAETGGRGFVITADERFLEPYTRARRDVPSIVTALRALTRDDPHQQLRLDPLARLIEQRFEILTRLIDLRRESRSDDASVSVCVHQGKAVMDHIRALLAQLENEEKLLLSERDRAVGETTRRANATLIAGAVLGVILLLGAFGAFNREVRVRRREEAVRKAGEATLQAILDNMPAIVFVKDLEGRFTHINRRFEALFGIPTERVVGKLTSDFFPPEVADPSRAADRRTIESGEPVEMEQALTVDGATHTFLIIRFPLSDASGSVYGLCGVATDITERKHIEEAIRVSEERLRLAVSGANLGTWHWTLSSNEIEVSDTCKALFGLPPDAPMLYDRFLEMLHADDRARIEGAIKEALVERKDYDVEYRTIWPDGSLHWIGAKGRGYYDGAGEADRMQGVVFDITERRLAEEHLVRLNARLETVNKELEAFSYSISHDLRAPLRAIDGFSQVLLEDYAGALDDAGKECLHRVRAGAQKMARLIDDLLTLSQISRKEFLPRGMDLSALARDVAEEVCGRDRTRAVAVEIEGGLVVQGDPGMLRIVLKNLFDNAWKFTKRKTDARVAFGVLPHEEAPVYFIRDNGAGFDMAYAGKLFSPFQRLHSSAEFEGTGVGLATVARVILHHGGRVWAEGTVEAGATIYFTLGTGPRPSTSEKEISCLTA